MRSLIIKLISLAAVSLALMSCGETEENNKQKEVEPGVYIKTEVIHPKPYTNFIDIIGVAKAIHQANISSDEGGRIDEFVKDKGEYAAKGQVIIRMDNEVLKANLDAAKARDDLAEVNFQKQQQVYKDSVTSEIQFLNAKYERDQAKANYDLIKSRYEKTFIKAPFSGVVDKKFAEVGELVVPTAPIVSLVNMSVIKIEAGVPEKYVNKIKEGNNVTVVFPDLDSAVYKGKINYVGHTISVNNRTFPIEINLNNSDRKIKPELNARVHIETETFQNAILIPEEVVTKTDEGDIVFVLNNGKAEMRKVEVVSRRDNMAALKNGLHEGDKLIVVGYHDLVDGEKVIVTE